MKISELQARQGKVDIIADVVKMEDPRVFDKFGKSGRVCNAIIKDESGEVKLTLWNDEIDKVKLGLKIHIINGYVGEWQGEKQLSAGKFGSIEIVGDSEIVPEQPKPIEKPAVPIQKPEPKQQTKMNYEDDLDSDDGYNDLDVEEESI